MIVKGRLLVTLEALRQSAGRALNIESGCRCEKKNAAISGAKDSGHLTGEAADVWVAGLRNRGLGALVKDLYKRGSLPYLRYCYLIKGTSNTRVHVGVDDKPRNNVFEF